MNTHDQNLHGQNNGDDMPDALRWQLRGLRNDSLPQRDLWAGIAARIAAEAADQPAAPNVVSLRPRNARRATTWLAMAASLTLAVGIGWQLRPSAPATQPATSSIAQVANGTHPSGGLTTLYAREADAMGWEYKAALREIDTRDMSAADARALRQLDHGVAQVRSALAQDPEARFLFDRLQKLYAQRLALTQRLALS